MNRKSFFQKIISLFLVIIIIVSFNSGCKHYDIGPGDEDNLYYSQNGHILISENPFLLLYLNPEGRHEGYLEVDGKVEHFYLIDMYTTLTSAVVAFTKEYIPHETEPYKKDDNVFMYCNLIHKTDYEVVEVIDPETQGSSGEEFVLNLTNIPTEETSKKFEEFKNQSKQEILNYFKANI